MARLLALIIIMLVSFTTFSQSGKEAEVWARVDALNKAVFGSKDSVVIRGLVGKKLTYGHSGGNIEEMAAMIHNAAVSPTTYKNTTTERLSLQFIERKVVIARFIYRATSVDEKGVESPLNLGILQVWSKEGGKWLLQARQAVRVNPK